MSKTKNVLKYSYLTYIPYNLRNSEQLSEKEMRKEYKRLRDVAQKRLQRLGKSEFSDSAAYQNKKDFFIPLKEVKTKSHLINLLSEAAFFLSAKSSSVTGQREIVAKTAQTFKEHYPEIATQDWTDKEFYEYLSYYQKIGLKNVISSDDEIEIYMTARSRNMTIASLKKDIVFWAEHKEELSSYTPKDGRQHSSEHIRKEIFD